MSEAEYHTLTDRCLRPSVWTAFSHADDLFSHAHRMLIGEAPAEESRAKRRAPPSSPARARKTGSSGDDGGTKKDSPGVPRSVAAAFRAPPPPLLPMSPAVADGAPSKARRPAAAATRGCRVSPPPLLPMSYAPFATPPVEAPSPSASPPYQRTPPPSPLATPPSTPPGKVPTPPRTATPQPGCSSCHARNETEGERQLKKRVCGVCGDLARSLHFGGLACDSCKAFFRRAVLSKTFADFTCRKDHHCTITVGSRRSCQACRFAGCLRAGMRISLAKREDETTGRVSHPSPDPQRRLDRPPSFIPTHERLRSHNTVYGKTFHAGPAFPAHVAGGTSLAPDICSLVPDPESLTPVPGDAFSSTAGAFQGFAQDFDVVLRQARLSQARGASSSVAVSSRSPYMSRSPLHASASGYGSTKRYSPISSHTSVIAHSPTNCSHSPVTIDCLSGSHTSTAIHRPSSSHAPTRSHSPTRNHKPANGPNPNNHTHRSISNFPLPQTSKRSLSPSASSRSPSTSNRSLSSSSRSPSTSSRSPSTTSPITSWLGVQPVPPAEEHLSNPSGSTSKMSCPKSDRELDSYLEHQDHTEIEELQISYSSTFDVKSLLPVGERMIRSEELSKLYTCFIQRRARFLVSTPLYRSLAQSDRLKLLHVAVAMSTYFTGAHLIDTKDYTWKNRNSTDGKAFPVMSASTIRQFLSHEQFVYVMRFYTTYSPVFSDQTVAILMQVLSLFYPEPGLEDPRAAEQGRLHYIALLSRYLRSKYGPLAGSERLRTLIGSQQEARQLVDLLQHVELTPQAPREDVMDSQKILVEGIQLVCNNARESLVKGVREKQEGFACDGSEAVSPTRGSQTAGIPVNTTSIQDAERLDFIEKTFNRLANCEDPYILAEARRILPADLVMRFFQQLQCNSASNNT